MSEYEIKEYTDEAGVVRWTYRGWDLKQVCSTRRPEVRYWLAYPPHEIPVEEYAAIVTSARFTHKPPRFDPAAMFARPVLGSTYNWSRTIEDCIDKFEDYLERARREAFEQAGVRME